MFTKNWLLHPFQIIKIFSQSRFGNNQNSQCVRFRQTEIYKPFIDMNTKLRSGAKNLFDKKFYKQKNCSLFSKSMENVRNRLKVKLVGEAYTYIHYASKPTFSCAHVLAPDFSIAVFTNDNVKCWI